MWLFVILQYTAGVETYVSHMGLSKLCPLIMCTAHGRKANSKIWLQIWILHVQLWLWIQSCCSKAVHARPLQERRQSGKLLENLSRTGTGMHNYGMEHQIRRLIQNLRHRLLMCIISWVLVGHHDFKRKTQIWPCFKKKHKSDQSLDTLFM